MSGSHNEQIAYNPVFLKEEAKKALAEAKILEKKQVKKGAVWVDGPNRSKILKK